MPELLDYRVNIRIHDNIIACNAIVAMQENKNTQIQRNISKIFFRLYRIQRKYVHTYIYTLLRSISRRSMRIRPFAEQSGKLKRAVGVLFFYRKVYIYIYDMVTQSGMYNGYNIPRNSIMLTQPRSNSPGMPARIVIR